MFYKNDAVSTEFNSLFTYNETDYTITLRPGLSETKAGVYYFEIKYTGFATKHIFYLTLVLQRSQYDTYLDLKTGNTITYIMIADCITTCF